MTIKELIEALSAFPPDMSIAVRGTEWDLGLAGVHGGHDYITQTDVVIIEPDESGPERKLAI